MGLGNSPKRDNLQKWLGEGVKGLMHLSEMRAAEAGRDLLMACGTTLAPLAFPLFCTLFSRGLGTERLSDYQGEGGDHVHCTVEPSPGHSWC